MCADSLFDALQTGNKLDKEAFDRRELPLRRALLQAQNALHDADSPVIVIVAGAEGSGKGMLVHRLNEWMDPRTINTEAFWEASDEEQSRPSHWRFWRGLPPRGRIGIFFGSWYTQPLYKRSLRTWNKAEYHRSLQHICDLERMLCDDGAVLVKLWFHVSRETQQRQFAQEEPHRQQNLRTGLEDLVTDKLYKKLQKAGEQAIETTHSNTAPWHVIDAEDRLFRDITAGEIILSAMQRKLSGAVNPGPATSPPPAPETSALNSVDLSATLARPEYRNHLRARQSDLQALAWKARHQGRSVVALFEGWDAAGKGSSIRRVTQAIDPRLFRLNQYAAPTEQEHRYHYLWRFWRDLARDGTHSFFDRSWYGRVLVERVEGFAAEDEWQRAYHEINRFEEQLTDHGSLVLKFWIHVSPEEQLKRFQERENTPHKRYKITPEDWRNRDKRPAYEAAVEDMVARTSTPHAPWTLIAGEDKKFARIQILDTFCHAMSDWLKSGKG